MNWNRVFSVEECDLLLILVELVCLTTSWVTVPEEANSVLIVLVAVDHRHGLEQLAILIVLKISTITEVNNLIVVDSVVSTDRVALDFLKPVARKLLHNLSEVTLSILFALVLI